MHKPYKKELVNLEKEIKDETKCYQEDMKGYLALAREVFEVLSSQDDPCQLRKEIASLFWSFFKCKKVIYCSASQIISVPWQRLSDDDIHNIKAWFDKRTFDNYTSVEVCGPKSYRTRFYYSDLLDIAVMLPLVISDKDEDKKFFASYIALGYKKSGQPFNKNEIDYLKKIRTYLNFIVEQDYKELKTRKPYKPLNKARQIWNDYYAGLDDYEPLEATPQPPHLKSVK